MHLPKVGPVRKANMNKQEIIDALAQKMATDKATAEKMLVSFTEVVTEALKSGQEVNISGFGSFSVSERAA
ncbi:MAG: HU family DNA-binding protein, partial [Candidatus Saccharibacteria bacterium]